MYRWSTEVLFFSPKTKDYEMMSGANHQCDLYDRCTFTGSDQSPRKATGKRRSSLASESFQTEGVFGGWTCCISCGRFTRGFRLFGLLFALLICTTKNARTTMAPRKAKTGIVCPTSWLYRPGIIPGKPKRFGATDDRLSELRCLCSVNTTYQNDPTGTLIQTWNSY